MAGLLWSIYIHPQKHLNMINGTILPINSKHYYKIYKNW